ncbi:MAG: alanine--tRNA ligase [Phycisphaeraceae bacterium]|nr:alanine--tRNA ligase [Phycisphaeraceae bacterium]MCB9847318.1 alanine--tRNA ligase [Phycisphaeraceae bacterium]
MTAATPQPTLSTTPPTTAEVRRQFIDYFVRKQGHTFVPSSPVVPHDDPTLLFTNAGMNQFKPIFLGDLAPGDKRAGWTRAVNTQKCIRAGGKHNDLDDVGKDTYHHTFFEMLGNWSFGDYFKKEAIEWAWDLLVNVWGLDPGRCYATYFGGDEALGLDPDTEARDLWLKLLPESRVMPFGVKDNFWEMGDTGPCGPCSEIHYDSRPDEERAAKDGAALVNMDDPDLIEIWNLVFIQYNRSASGLAPLPARHVDTGMGLERIARVLQGKRSNYDTDAFTPIFEAIRRITNAPAYTGILEDHKDIAYRVVADHIRTLVFAITDGAVPDNAGRGSVLRSVLRRAARMGRQYLNTTEPFLYKLVPAVVELMGEAFPELRKDPGRVADVIRGEEESFGRTIGEGLYRFIESVLRAFEHTKVKQSALPDYCSSASVLTDIARGSIRIIGVDDKGAEYPLDSFGIDGPHTEGYIEKNFEHRPQILPTDAFKLHDTYGFPIDLTRVMAEERGLTVDVEGFERLMEEARETARAGGKGCDTPPALVMDATAIGHCKNLGVQPTHDDAKFENKRLMTATVRAIWNGRDFDENAEAGAVNNAARFSVILDRTSFFAEMGGQVGDMGRLRVVRESKSNARDSNHGGEFEVLDTRAYGGFVTHFGRVRKGEIRVGDTVEIVLDTQRRDQIRANHTATHLLNLAIRDAAGEGHDQKGSLVAPDHLRFDFSANEPLNDDQVRGIEIIVRDAIARDLPVYAETAPLELAKQVNGLRAVFGEVYPDPVRVVSVGVPIADLLSDAGSAKWKATSVEFCGGTHLDSTAGAKMFAITEETSVAKGVRRIEALTGDRAEAAIQAGDMLIDKAEAAATLPDDQLAEAVRAIGAEVDAAHVPLAKKRDARSALEKLGERVKALRKQAQASGRESSVDAARELAAQASGAVICGVIPAGSDRNALLAALDVLKSKHAGSATLLASPDEEAGKVTIVAAVPQALIDRGLRAGDWVREASQACGGKGGGRPDSAQGGGTEPGKVGEAIAAAQAYAMSRLGPG